MKAIYAARLQATAKDIEAEAGEHPDLDNSIHLRLTDSGSNGITFTGTAEEITGLLERISAAVTTLSREIQVRERIEAELGTVLTGGES